MFTVGYTWFGRKLAGPKSGEASGRKTASEYEPMHLGRAALDVGYRYMLNLPQLNDRNGFTIKISKLFGWSKH
jgi:hypothetical protein